MVVRASLIAMVLVAVVATPGCGSSTDTFDEGAGGAASKDVHSAEISQATFSGEWPFTVRSGILRCDGDERIGAITFEADGEVYAVNGTAKSLHAGRDIDDIWRPDPDVPGMRINIGDVIDKGLSLC